ncbi:LLM class flavin-dependent oxidoreductase [Aquibacillus albus]|uniref:Pyrimidine oxygenase n=1 Tax=Aquibacillus albus TaxID=1168171 RepID=A0ABS2N3J7_9BACI|nr:LLM class flavin-dependent oxidoreductase [Aquibacillus albus]MBM7572691.1 pyrimidine oxygenase [Aquibacillus albus]
MDFGIFLPIANNGWIVSNNSPHYMPTFELNKEISVMAERMDLDFVLSMVKYRGYGGETEHWDYAMDSFNLMAGIAAVTSKIGIYATVQPLTLNPAIAARMAATVDDISQGRFGLNVVAGWNKFEYSQMGLWPGDDYYQYRYEYTDEWLSIVKELWRNGRVTHHGKYFNLDDCLCQPTPITKPNPPIVCAGMSDTGLQFTVKHCDINFVVGDLETIKNVSTKGKILAQKAGKSIKTYALYTIITADTDEEAEKINEQYLAGSAQSSLAGLKAASSNDKGSMKETFTEKLKNVYMCPPIVGSPETVVDYIDYLSKNTDIDGLLFTFPDFIKGMENFEKEILARIDEKGLRSKIAI